MSRSQDHGGGPSTMRSKLNKFEHVWGSVYSDVQCIMGNGHMGPPSGGQTYTAENISFATPLTGGNKALHP